MRKRDELVSAMVDGWHESIGYPNPDFCLCGAEEHADQMVETVIDFVEKWIRDSVPDYPDDAAGLWIEDMGI